MCSEGTVFESSGSQRSLPGPHTPIPPVSVPTLFLLRGGPPVVAGALPVLAGAPPVFASFVQMPPSAI
eukprot:8823110-Pyramimonas_sp.AAC.1